GYVTVFPTGVTKPNASNLNFPANRTEANSVTVKLGASGKVDFYNNAGNTNVIADVTGYFAGDDTIAPGGEYQPFDPPLRLLDTRATGGGGPLSPHGIVVDGLNFNQQGGPDVNAHIKAFAINLTAVGPTASGYLTAWNGILNEQPSTSTVNFPKGA